MVKWVKKDCGRGAPEGSYGGSQLGTRAREKSIINQNQGLGGKKRHTTHRREKKGRKPSTGTKTRSKRGKKELITRFKKKRDVLIGIPIRVARSRSEEGRRGIAILRLDRAPKLIENDKASINARGGDRVLTEKIEWGRPAEGWKSGRKREKTLTLAERCTK